MSKTTAKTAAATKTAAPAKTAKGTAAKAAPAKTSKKTAPVEVETETEKAAYGSRGYARPDTSKTHVGEDGNIYNPFATIGFDAEGKRIYFSVKFEKLNNKGEPWKIAITSEDYDVPKLVLEDNGDGTANLTAYIGKKAKTNPVPFTLVDAADWKIKIRRTWAAAKPAVTSLWTA